MARLAELLSLPDDPELVALLQRYARWWARLLAGLILMLGVLW
jgi:hypothetical protein